MRRGRPVDANASNVVRRDDASAAKPRRSRPLTAPQRAMLALLNDGLEADSVGLEAEMLNAHQIAVCERLVGQDLVRFDIGWRYSCWFRLTPAGREAMRNLRTAEPTGVPPSVSRRTGGASNPCQTPKPSNPTRTGTHEQT